MGKEREGGDGTAQRFQQLNQHLGFLAVKRKEVGKTLNLMLLMLFIIGDCTKGADFSKCDCETLVPCRPAFLGVT